MMSLSTCTSNGMRSLCVMTNRAAILMSAILIAGCAATNDRGDVQKQVQLADFTASSAEMGQSTDGRTGENDMSAPRADDIATSEVETSEGGQGGAAPSPAPTPPAPTARVSPGERLMKPGDVVIIDSVIGQVSGRPIFAEELLDPISDRLRQEAAQLNANDFQVRAQQLIMERLREVVLTELFIAEAEASLTSEQQQGLMAFLRNLQEKTIATGQGSRTVTEERLMEEMNMTIEEYTERERYTILINMLINRKINPRVIVSWKDVQRAYEQRKNEFNPPATITYSRITLLKEEEAELVQQVQAALQESFAKAAETAGAENVSLEGPFAYGPEGVSEMAVSEAIRPHLIGLKLNETSVPIELGRRVMWWHVAAIDQPPARSLYDVQRTLINDLTIRRENEERERYIRTMFEKGIHDEVDEMLRRAMTVALLRYGK